MGACDQLVVVLPGIGGTVLTVPDRLGKPTEDVVWGARGQDLRLLRHPEMLSTSTYARLAPKGLIPTRTAFGIWTPVHGYSGLLDRLNQRPGAVLDDGTGKNPKDDANVVAVGYDFRLGVEDAADQLDEQLRRRLTHRWGTDESAWTGRVYLWRIRWAGWWRVIGRRS
jgi:hypothetical protein